MIICRPQCDIDDMVREAQPRKAAKAPYLLELQDLLGDKAVLSLQYYNYLISTIKEW